MTEQDVTVVIPLYNKQETIQRAVSSVCKQSKLPAEVIVIDDGSTDGSPDIVKKMQTEYSFLRLVRQENRGVASARNHGAERAQTPLVCFLDADDEWLKNYMNDILKLVNGSPEAEFYSLSHILCRKGRTTRPKVALSNDHAGIVRDFIRVYRKGYGIIHSSSVCFRKSFFNDLGGFPEGETSGEDIYLWLQAGMKGSFAFYNKPGVIVYKDPASGAARREQTVSFHFRYFSKQLPHIPAGKRNDIKKFLLKNILIKWAASKVDGNRWQRKQLREISRKISLPWYLLFNILEAVPRSVFVWIQKVRQRT